MKNWLYSSSLSICLLLSCNKRIKNDYPVEGGCEKFAGKYQMYDPQNDVSYIMVVSCLPKITQTGKDTLVFVNYANRFNYKAAISYGLNDPGHMSNVIINPLKDKNANSWAFSSGGYQGPDDKLNRLVEDSIYIRFSIDNTPYYIDDGVAFQACSFCQHLGVKIH